MAPFTGYITARSVIDRPGNGTSWLCNAQPLSPPAMSSSHAKLGASLVAQRLKRLPAIWETWVQSLGQEDPLEKDMATHSSILACRIPWGEEPGGLQSMGGKESDTTERLHSLMLIICFLLS